MSSAAYSPSGRRGDHRPRPRLARGEEQAERLVERVEAVLGHGLVDAPLGDPDRGELGIDVAHGEPRQADIVEDDADDVVDQPVVAGEADAGEAEPLLEDRRGVRRDAAGDRAADIEEMGDRDGIGDQPAVGEDRPDDGEVAGVGAALEGIVGEEGVAGMHVGAEALDDELHLAREGAGEDGDAVGLGDEVAAPVADAAGEVEHLVDHRAHRGAGEHDRHLVDDGEQLAVDDLAGHRVGRPAARAVDGRGSRLHVARRCSWFPVTPMKGRRRNGDNDGDG